MNKLYVRVAPKKGITTFHRCAIAFTLAWLLVEVDNATAARLREEQMLEVSDTQPDDYVAPVAAADADTTANTTANTTNTPPELSAEERLAAIKQAITGLDADVASSWTKSGAPAVPAITAVVGFDVTAAERDQAWTETQAAKAE